MKVKLHYDTNGMKSTEIFTFWERMNFTQDWVEVGFSEQTSYVNLSLYPFNAHDSYLWNCTSQNLKFSF